MEEEANDGVLHTETTIERNIRTTNGKTEKKRSNSQTSTYTQKDVIYFKGG